MNNPDVNIKFLKPYKILLLMLVFLPSCSYLSTETPELNNSIKIGVSLYRQDDSFITSVRENIEDAARKQETEDNIKITVNVMDSKGNQGIQNDHIDLFISQGYDIICVNEVDRTAASLLIDKARSADIPLVFFNREPVEEDMQRWDKLYYIGSDPKEAGEMQGQIIAEAFRLYRENLDKNGDGKLQYVMLEGEPGHQDATVRTEHSIKTIQQSGIAVEKLASEAANWQRGEAIAIMNQWIANFGDSIEIVISNNDDMALGAIDAYQSNEIRALPFIVGIDGTASAIDALDAGSLYATVYNDAKGQGSAIFSIAYALATGKNPQAALEGMDEHYMWLPHKILTGNYPGEGS